MDSKKYTFHYSRSSKSDQTISLNEGLRSYMIGIYNLMAIGLFITGSVAYIVANTPSVWYMFLATPLRWIVIGAPFAIVLLFNMKMQSISVEMSRILFWTYSTLMGISMSSIFILFTGQSIARIFLITSSVFASMSLFGYTTKRDLTSFNSFLMMGLLGIIISSLINIFFHSSVLQFIISIISVLVFTGLTAYDTQNIRSIYYYNSNSGQENLKKIAIISALTLYLDVINIFISLLHIFGEQKR